MSGGDVEDFVGNMSQEGGELGSCDVTPFSCGRVEVNCSGEVAGSAKSFCAADNVEAGLCWTHPVGVRSTPVGEGLAIVIVFLLAEAECSEGDVVVGCGGNVVDGTPCGGGEAEVFHDDGHRGLAIAPIRVCDGFEGLVVVAAPLGFSEAGVAAECYPGCNCADE